METKELSALKYWKTLHRFVFAFAIMASVLFCLRVVYPYVLGISWQGSLFEEIVFILILWIVSSIFIGLSVAGTVIYSIYRTLKEAKENKSISAEGLVDKDTIASNFFSGSYARVLMSTSCLGPSVALLFLSIFFSSKLQLDDVSMVVKACALLGVVSFVFTLPLNVVAQSTLADRVKEKFDIDIDEDNQDAGTQIAEWEDPEDKEDKEDNQ